MAKISETTRLEFAETIKPYQSKITATLGKEKTVLNSINGGASDAPYKKLMLCDDMIYVASLYMAQNSLSLKILGVKNNDALNEARKILYKAIIYLEELVTNVIDIPYSDLVKNHETIQDKPIAERYYLIRKLGLAINLLEIAFGDNSKWKWSFVELKGRYAVVAKNLIDMRNSVKAYFDPNNEDYETTVLYVRLIIKQLEASAAGYRDKYEVSTRRLDDMRNAIKFLLARHKLAIAIGDKTNAEEIKKKALVWKDKMDADQKAGSGR
ncbi:MAG: hypothetical protein IIT58_13500 [Treponema sp.]|nr:hypothetical protein [Treponema sp.]